MKTRLTWFLKGAVMGIADAVPGVSGGTLALITGIYERLIAALAALRPATLRLLLAGQPGRAWQRIDGDFLLMLGLGILGSLFATLSLMHALLDTAPQLVWAFFAGLILASLGVLLRRQQWRPVDALLLALGTLIAAAVALSSSLALAVNPLTLMLGGALAISAMLLPGISGSFILLLLGLYPPVVEAVSERDLVVIGWVALGCLAGLLLFSRLLNWLLQRWHDRVLGFMLGFVVGALVKVWPWQFEQQWLMPGEFERVSGEPAMLGGCVLAALAGGLAIVGITWRSGFSAPVKS